MTGANVISSLTLPPVPQPVKAGGTVQDADSRTREMAREFEAVFLAMLLKQMRETLEPEGLFPGDSGDVQGGLFDLYLGRHLAENEGVGMAAALIRQMAPTAGAAK
jgi:flagellar protein FlgJ